MIVGDRRKSKFVLKNGKPTWYAVVCLYDGYEWYVARRLTKQEAEEYLQERRKMDPSLRSAAIVRYL